MTQHDFGSWASRSTSIATRARQRRVAAAGLAALAMTFAACSSDAASTTSTEAPATSAPGPVTSDGPSTQPDTSVADTTPLAPSPLSADEAAALDTAVAAGPGCDPLDPTRCLLPFPSDAYTVADATSDTGRRVAFAAEAMPANASGVSIDPTEWNRNDGFSPNTPILTYVAGLDADASQLPSWTDLESSLADNATVVVVDADTGERVPLWAELDAKAAADDDRLLEIHPAVVLPEGHRVVVALRGLVDTTGAPIAPSAAFRAYRDGLDTGIDAIEQRRPDMEATFATLAEAGIDREALQLAWSFTVASTRNLSERMLHIRDEALAQLGDAAPSFAITAVTPNSDDNIALQVEGTVEVPNFLTGDGGPGNRFFYGDGVQPTADALPVQNGTVQVPFVCNIPAATMNGTAPAHLVQYGHGLLGSNFEIDAGNVRAMANEHNVVFCATKWAGMSEDDIGNAAQTLGEFSNFATVADRLQQGVLNQIILGRLMIADGGLAGNPAFQRADGTPLIDTAHLDYDGNSQGAIMGLMLSAVSPDIERSVLGVAGMNYSVLLARSVDFATYEAFFQPAYPNDLDRVLILSMVQMLWDRGEGAGYVQHVTTAPYPNTPARTVLIHVAFGDWQVSELTAMIEARAVGATIHRPVTADGRSREKDPGWGLDSTVYPSTGSALVVWDSGSDPIPIANVPPSTSRDPHEDPRADADVRRQKASFLFDDRLIDVCGGAPCTADARD